MAPGRVQRWALTLAAYEYSIVRKAGIAHVNADALSRLPQPDMSSRTPEPADNMLVMPVLDSTPVDLGRIKTETRRDPVLARVCKMVQLGWPERCPDEGIIDGLNKIFTMVV